MAMVPRRPGALMRRVITWSIVVDIGVALFVGLVISSLLGWIVFILGLIVAAVTYFNVNQVLKTRGRR